MAKDEAEAPMGARDCADRRAQHAARQATSERGAAKQRRATGGFRGGVDAVRGAASIPPLR
jgi:hypothetical protein